MPNYQHLEWLEKFRIRPGTHLIEGQMSILLRHHRMPGDILTMTPLVRDLKNTYGEQVKIRVDTPQGEEIWQNSPYLTSGGIFVPDMTYDIDNKFAMENDARGLNMAEGFRQNFINKSGLHLNASDMWPDIWLTQDEIDSFEKRFPGLGKYTYWAICSGNKRSCRIKTWHKDRWRELIRAKKLYQFIHIGQSRHGHEPLFDNQFNYQNYIDRTPTLRDLFILMYFSRGSIGYNSLHMHISAAFRKPCIVLAGARESVTVYKYPNHTALSGMGYVRCGMYKGCYLSSKKGEHGIIGLCKISTVDTDVEDILPGCMDIKADHVIDAFDRYESNMAAYEDMRNDDHIVRSEHTELSARYSGKTEMKEKEVVPRVNGTSKKTFRMLCNTHSFGGGERTAVRIMKLMAEQGYEIELETLSSYINDDFILNCPELEFADKDKPCDIAFFQVNDSLIRDMQVASNIKLIVDNHFKMAKRKIVGVNYDVTGIEHYKDADCIIFQSTKLKDELGEIAATCDRHWIHELSKTGKIKVLHPPTDIQPFLDKYYDRDYSMIHLIRHSSQGDRKYDDNINEHIRKIYEARKDIDITLMPAPSFLHDMRVKMYPYNALRPLYFLTLGNVFWYWIPEEKYTEIGANVVLEAMASGLPILCNDNGGLIDIMRDGSYTQEEGNPFPRHGWICETEDEMYDVIENMTIEEIKEKGENARKRVQDIVRPDLWVKYIIGE